jgi:CRISPR-associated exonuclease Cas4
MDDDAIALSALQHHLYCPRQCALIHVEQLWEESRHTAEGRVLHEKADKPKIERRKGVRTVMAMPLSAPELGITGIADVVEFHQTAQGEQAFPVEYKRGRPKPHRADEVQLCAQALCLESMLGQPIAAGALYYGQTRRRTDVAFDAELRQLTLDTIAAVRAMLAAGITPTARYSARRCDACSLLDLCQPRLLGRTRSVNDWLAAQWHKDSEAGGRLCADN